MKIIFGLLASVLLAVSPAFAGDMACCATKTGKMECSQIYAKLNLTPEQKTKLDGLQQTCEKEGCTQDSMQKFFAEAKGVLSPEQYAQLKAGCSKMQPPTEKPGS